MRDAGAEVPIWSLALTTPFYCHEATIQSLYGIWISFDGESESWAVLAGEERAVAFDGGEKLFAEGVVDHADDGSLCHGEGEGDCCVGKPVDEVEGAVDWVADECWLVG